jgi:nucleoside-diphosphate-sugar epimerase
MQGQAFNVSSSEPRLTKEQIAQRIKKQVDCDLQFAESNSYMDRRDYHLSTQKIEALGYHTNVSLDQGIMELIYAVNKLKIDKNYFNTLAPFNG